MPLDASKPALQEIGDYEIVEKIADGGMGTVYKARRRGGGPIVAVKVLAPNARNPVILKRFEQEFRLAHMLEHPNVVKAIEYCSGPTPFLVMEYVEGESLGQKIDRDGRMREEEALRIIAQVCQGLYRAHKLGLIHRDVKPDNVLITPEGQAKLIDLGLAKVADAEVELTKTGRGLGTPHYMAPEQFRNAKNADARCDIYSVAATLYAMVTGETPFGKCGPLECWMKKQQSEFPSPRSLVPELSERLDWAIRRAMNADPEVRPATCREFFEDLIGQSTRPAGALSGGEPPQDLWYLVYKDELNETHTVKGGTEAIRKALRDRLLGDAETVRACRTKLGPFRPLKSFPEFRDLLLDPTTALPAVGSGRLSYAETGDGEAAPPGGASPGRVSGSYGGPPAGAPPARAANSAPWNPYATPPPGPNSGKQTGPLPHIRMRSRRDDGPEWLVWLAVLIIAVASAIAGALYLQ